MFLCIGFLCRGSHQETWQGLSPVPGVSAGNDRLQVCGGGCLAEGTACVVLACCRGFGTRLYQKLPCSIRLVPNSAGGQAAPARAECGVTWFPGSPYSHSGLSGGRGIGRTLHWLTGSIDAQMGCGILISTSSMPRAASSS